MLINILILAILLVLFVALSMLWPPDSPWAPWWRTSRRIARAMCKIADVDAKDTLYELGSGDGATLITAAEEYGAKGVGIEIDPVRVFVSKLRVKFGKSSGSVNIIRKNFFDVDLHDASVVFVYLVPKALIRLKFKFASELKPGTKIVSYRYQIPYLPLVKRDKIHKLYYYTIPKSFVS